MLKPAEWADVLARVPDTARQTVWANIRRLVLQALADYSRRFLARFAGYPYRLLLLAKCAPDVECAERKTVARELLSVPLNKLHITAAKFRVCFSGALAIAADTGAFDMRAFAPIWLIACFWRGGTQEVEGVNSLLQCITRRAPSMSLPLLDARVAIRKAAGLGTRSSSNKWSDVAPDVQRIIEDAVAHHKDHVSRYLHIMIAMLCYLVCGHGSFLACRCPCERAW